VHVAAVCEREAGPHLGLKVFAAFTVPLCVGHHDAIHRSGNEPAGGPEVPSPRRRHVIADHGDKRAESMMSVASSVPMPVAVAAPAAVPPAMAMTMEMTAAAPALATMTMPTSTVAMSPTPTAMIAVRLFNESGANGFRVRHCRGGLAGPPDQNDDSKCEKCCRQSKPRFAHVQPPVAKRLLSAFCFLRSVAYAWRGRPE
jgi:hypothetical protein